MTELVTHRSRAWRKSVSAIGAREHAKGIRSTRLWTLTAINAVVDDSDQCELCTCQRSIAVVDAIANPTQVLQLSQSRFAIELGPPMWSRSIVDCTLVN